MSDLYDCVLTKISFFFLPHTHTAPAPGLNGVATVFCTPLLAAVFAPNLLLMSPLLEPGVTPQSSLSQSSPGITSQPWFRHHFHKHNHSRLRLYTPFRNAGCVHPPPTLTYRFVNRQLVEATRRWNSPMQQHSIPLSLTHTRLSDGRLDRRLTWWKPRDCAIVSAHAFFGCMQGT